jgi:hypothetical protein
VFVAESLASRATAAKRRAAARAAARAELEKGSSALDAGDLEQARARAEAAERLFREAGDSTPPELERLVKAAAEAARRARAAERQAAGETALAEAETALGQGLVGLASTRLLAARSVPLRLIVLYLEPKVHTWFLAIIVDLS